MTSPRVSLVTSLGHSGDHWLTRVLNHIPGVLALNAPEGVRHKYFGGNRGKRPDIVTYVEYLRDLGAEMDAIVDVHSYRGCHVDEANLPPDVRVVNLVRHPYAWLELFVAHRVNNCRMPAGDTRALDHEWKYLDKEFACLGGEYLERKDVAHWAYLKGCCVLNYAPTKQPCIDIQRNLAGLAQWITGKNISDELNEKAQEWTASNIRDEPVVVGDVSPCDWQQDAFDPLVTDETKDWFRSLGYSL